MNRSLAALLLLIPSFVSVRAQTSAESLQDARRAWSALPADRQAAIRANYRLYQSMPPGEKLLMKERYARFQALPRERREKLLRGWLWFRSLPDSKRLELRLRYRDVLRSKAENRERRESSRGEDRSRFEPWSAEPGPHAGPHRR